MIIGVKWFTIDAGIMDVLQSWVISKILRGLQVGQNKDLRGLQVSQNKDLRGIQASQNKDLRGLQKWVRIKI